MTRVVFLITELERGGAELALLRLVRGLDRSRFVPQAVFSLDAIGPVGQLIEKADVPVISLRLRERPVGAMADLAAALRRLRPDILQTFLFHANVVGRLIGRMVGVPRVVASVRVTEVDRPWRAAVERIAYRGVDRVVCVAEAVRSYMRSRTGLPDGRIVVVPNGVDPVRPASRSATGAKRILTVAHLRHQKGIDLLVRAAAVVVRHVPDASFTVVGRGDPEPYRRQAQELGVESSIRFAGPSSELEPFLAVADLFVLPSRWEGCPNAVLEAMAAGIPVVATAVGGTPELVVDGVTGLLSPPDSPQVLALRMIDLLRDPARARAMGDAGRARAVTAFPVQRMVDRFASLYEELRGRAGPTVA